MTERHDKHGLKVASELAEFIETAPFRGQGWRPMYSGAVLRV